jgi:Protein of unknown function (DUF3267).
MYISFFIIYSQIVLFQRFAFLQLVHFVFSPIILLAGIVVHELIHGITWSFFCEKGWKSIHFGVLWKMLTPYCHCAEPLLKRQYVIGAMMPMVILGLVPSILALFTGSFGMLLFGIIFINAACGDILICWKIRKESPDTLVLDHPSEAGCWVYRKGDY